MFIGRSNVGKSSAINRICASKSLARVSSSPGKTATVNYYLLDNRAYLVDLPGYGYAARSKQQSRAWGELIDAYLSQCRDISLLIQLIDCRCGPTELDEMMLDWLREAGKPFIVLFTKWDKLRAGAREPRYRELFAMPVFSGARAIFPFSSENGTGVNEVRTMLSNLLL